MRSVVLPDTRRAAVAAMIALALAPGCGDPAARVAIAPLGGDCARPSGANAVKVTAYTAGGETSRSLGLTESIAIADFPADTEQIAIEVIVGGGGIGAAGKSGPLVFGALADGAAIPVMMAPPDGFCELPGMAEARAQPLIARAGDGALVVGGTGPSGPLSTAEYYDPATATFAPVDVPTGLVDDQGFTGAALATLPDGRVAVIGGPRAAFVVFDPARRAFVADPALIEAWLFSAAIAVADQEVLVAGGCSTLNATRCVPRLQTRRYQLGKLSASALSVILTPGPRVSPELFDLGVQLDGKRRYLLAGGTTEVGRGGAIDHADRFALDDDRAEAVTGGHTRVAALDGGAVLTAFGDDDPATEPDGAAAVYAPEAAAARPIAGAPARRGVRLIALEDGRVLGVGGDPLGQVVTYDPTRDAWMAAAPVSPAQTGLLTRPSLVRLGDGSVLVVGGAVSPRAWLYRPSLVGPASGSVTAVPASDAGRGVVTAPDPATVTRAANPASWQLAAPADATTAMAPAMARALVGGPRPAVGSVRATVHVAAGGVALIAQQTAPGQAIVAELAPGAPPRLVRLAGGAEHVVCNATDPVAAFDPAAPVTLQLAISDRDARLSIGARDVLVCGLAATDRGAWGIASLGAGARLTIDTVTVARGRPAT
jgi:hypothetical protein